MINRLKQLKNLSVPQRLIRAMIIKLFQAKIKLGQGARATNHKQLKTYIKMSPKELRQSFIKKLMTTLKT